MMYSSLAPDCPRWPRSALPGHWQGLRGLPGEKFGEPGDLVLEMAKSAGAATACGSSSRLAMSASRLSSRFIAAWLGGGGMDGRGGPVARSSIRAAMRIERAIISPAAADWSSPSIFLDRSER